MSTFVRRTEYFLKHHWLTIAFVMGFMTDMILLNQIDNLFDNLILLFYVCLATISMLLLYVGVSEKGPHFLVRFFNWSSPIVMQYAFGGLLSGMLIFYGRSGDWLSSAPFFFLIVGVILGNEMIDKRSDKLIYHITLYFIGLFSYVVMVLPVLTGKMGDEMFLLSGLIALMLVTFVVQLLYRIVPHFMALNTKRVILSIGSVYILFNVFYFTSIIPPIPLSLTTLDVVQSVDSFVTESGSKSYRVTYELQPWYRKVPFVDDVLHPTQSSIACFARVYAPTRLATTIYHRWEYEDANGNWVQHGDRIGYAIAGSNQAGYGGYTRIGAFAAGVWRCSVETERGQVLGRREVRIAAGTPTRLETRVE